VENFCRVGLATNDFAASILLPSLGARISGEAPQVNIRVIAADDPLAMTLLDQDAVDLAIANLNAYHIASDCFYDSCRLISKTRW
jgi:DNA-binding transcriptional LysR family regulator